MPPDINFTFRTPAELKEAFVKSAKLNNRNASLLLRDFMQEYIDRHHASPTPTDKDRQEAAGGR